MNAEREILRLTKKYEDKGFVQYFYLENGSLVCSDQDQVLREPVIKVFEKQYYPKCEGIPHGFCIYAILVWNEGYFFKGIFLLPEGFVSIKEVSADVDRQLQLNNSYPQLFMSGL